MKISFEIKFVREDKWIGVYHDRNLNYGHTGEKDEEYGRTFYVCIIPCFPIIFRVNKKWAYQFTNKMI